MLIGSVTTKISNDQESWRVEGETVAKEKRTNNDKMQFLKVAHMQCAKTVNFPESGRAEIPSALRGHTAHPSLPTHNLAFSASLASLSVS